MTSPFEFVGLEIHSRRMWETAQVHQALDFMEENGFNALIFHQSDMMNRAVLPRRYVSVRTLWEKFNALRYFEVENVQHYLRLTAQEAARRGIGFWLNLKEIFFPDEIPELFPDLRNPENGIVCPTHPFWADYIEACTEELCEAVPELTGVILSAGTHECRTSITRQNPCGCARCRQTEPQEWYRTIFGAVQRPLQRAGKAFIIRDFTFTRGNQSVLLKAAEGLSGDVGVSLKNTPHDYYPTFPNNPRIGTTGHREIVEFDTWGQFFGGGFFPVSIAEDMQQRIRFCRDRGASGLLFRTDWEGMFENSTFNSANRVNLYAAGILSRDPDADLNTAYRAWGSEGWTSALTPGSFRPAPQKAADPEAWRRMRDFAKESWEVMRRTVYVQDHWFCEDNMFPDSLDKAWKMMVRVHGRDDWEKGASDRLRPTPENVEVILKEKEEALKRADRLREILAPEESGFPEETIRAIDRTLTLYRMYIRIGQASCRAVFRTEQALASGKEEDRREALTAAAALCGLRPEVEAVLAAGEHPHIACWLLNGRRMEELARDAERLLAAGREGA